MSDNQMVDNEVLCACGHPKGLHTFINLVCNSQAGDGCRCQGFTPARRRVEEETGKHQWDKSGERHRICGDKDWMNTPCRQPEPSATINEGCGKPGHMSSIQGREIGAGETVFCRTCHDEQDAATEGMSMIQIERPTSAELLARLRTLLEDQYAGCVTPDWVNEAIWIVRTFETMPAPASPNAERDQLTPWECRHLTNLRNAIAETIPEGETVGDFALLARPSQMMLELKSAKEVGFGEGVEAAAKWLQNRSEYNMRKSTEVSRELRDKFTSMANEDGYCSAQIKDALTPALPVEDGKVSKQKGE